MNAAVLNTINQKPCFAQFPEPVAEENEVIVHVRAAALKPIDKQMASGSHYAAHGKLPVVCGMDGVGRLDDGTRVFFGGPRPPYGSMAERTVVSRARCFPIPDNVNDDIAAAVVNPGLSAWGAFVWRAQLAPGETVLILGATGVTGKLAIQMAKLLGAGRVIAVGRNEQVLNTFTTSEPTRPYTSGSPTRISPKRSFAKLVTAASTSSSTTFGVLLPKLFLPPLHEEI